MSWYENVLWTEDHDRGKPGAGRRAVGGTQPVRRLQEAISDPGLEYRNLVAAALARASLLEKPQDLEAWDLNEVRGVVLLTLRSEEELSLRSGPAMLDIPSLVVAVLWDLSADLHGRGPRSKASPAAGGRRTPDRPAEPPRLERHDLELLRYLASGISVTEIARQTSYSRRHVHRELERLYRKLGVGNRSEAVVWSIRRGLID